VAEIIPNPLATVEALESFAFPSTMLLQTQASLKHTDLLTCFGFPDDPRNSVDNNFAIFNFKAYPATVLMTARRYDLPKVSQMFYLDEPSVQGYSGGPVINFGYQDVGSGIRMSTSSPTIIVGFMQGTRGDATGGKMSAVTPSWYLFDIMK
jgi:hypothetical protein